MKRLFPIAFALILSSCAIFGDNSFQYNVYISPEFDQKQIDTITSSLNDWSFATNGKFTFSYFIQPANSDFGSIAIIPFKSSDHTIMGDATYRHFSNRSVIRIDTEIGLYNKDIINHEIGHSLGLKHSDYGVMKPIVWGDMQITCQNVQDLCDARRIKDCECNAIE